LLAVGLGHTCIAFPVGRGTLADWLLFAWMMSGPFTAAGGMLGGVYAVLDAIAQLKP
jgi:hypothetical protein